MQWIKADVYMLDLDVSDMALAAWLRLSLYWGATERIEDSLPAKKPRSWPISVEEYTELLSSALVIDDCLRFSPCEEVISVQGQRIKGKLGGRPKKNKPGVITEGKNGGIPEVANRGAEPEKIREDKIRLDKTKEETVSATPPAPPHDLPADEPLDIIKPHAPLTGTDEERWRMTIQMQPWAQAIKRANCPIGGNNWVQWEALLEEKFSGDVKALVTFAKTLTGKRWPDAVEKAATERNPTNDPARYTARHSKFDAEPIIL